MTSFTTGRDELQASLNTVKAHLSKAKIQPRQGTDFLEVLTISEAWLKTTPESGILVPWSVEKLAWALCILSRLAFIIGQLQLKRIPFESHLKGMASHGSAKYGKKDPQSQIQFKDLEFEAYVAANLARADFAFTLNRVGAPFDITFGGKLEVDCKHPSSASKIAPMITDFGLKLGDRKGVLVFGIEDVLELWSNQHFAKRSHFGNLIRSRFDRVNAEHGPGWKSNMARFPSIARVYFFASGMMNYVDSDGASKITIQTMLTTTPQSCTDPETKGLIDTFDAAINTMVDPSVQ